MTDLRSHMTTHGFLSEEFSPEQAQKAARTGRLLTMELELSRVCNLRCRYCYSNAGTPLADELTPEEILDAVRQAAALGARKIVILGGGEPLLYPGLLALIDDAHALSLRCEVFTNGTLIDRTVAAGLFARSVAVIVKRNSDDPAVQDDLAGVPGTFQRIQDGLHALMNAGYPDATHTLGVQTVICRANLHEIPDLWRWARNRGIVPYFETLTVQGRAREHDDLNITPAEAREVFHALSRIDRDDYGIDWVPRPPLVGSGCTRHLYSILIKSDGDLYPCVGVEIAVGNIRRNALAEIIRDDPVVRSCREIYERIKGPCRSCSLNGTCYGCRGNAFQATGDHLASDPQCWRHEE